MKVSLQSAISFLGNNKENIAFGIVAAAAIVMSFFTDTTDADTARDEAVRLCIESCKNSRFSVLCSMGCGSPD